MESNRIHWSLVFTTALIFPPNSSSKGLRTESPNNYIHHLIDSDYAVAC